MIVYCRESDFTFCTIDTERMSCTLTAPMGARRYHKALKDEWASNLILSKFPFPLLVDPDDETGLLNIHAHHPWKVDGLELITNWRA